MVHNVDSSAQTTRSFRKFIDDVSAMVAFSGTNFFVFSLLEKENDFQPNKDRRTRLSHELTAEDEG